MTATTVAVSASPQVSIDATPVGYVLVDLTTATPVVTQQTHPVDVQVDTPGVTAGIPGLRGAPGTPGEPGPPGQAGTAENAGYRHYQSTAAAVWTIIHPLAFQPNVTVVDSTGREVWPGEVEYLTSDTIRLVFSAAFGGQAFLS